jgi:hypothetical protein
MVNDMEQNGHNFTGKRRAIIDRMALPPYPSLSAAARAETISASTVLKWNMDTAFRSAWQEARDTNQAELRQAAKNRLHTELPSILEKKIGLGMNAQSEHVQHLELKDLLDRILGQTTQKAELSGPDGGPVALLAALDAVWSRALPDESTG